MGGLVILAICSRFQGIGNRPGADVRLDLDPSLTIMQCYIVARIHVAKQEAGNSMIRYQQIVFPLCTEIQLSVIAQFGFQPDGEGIIQVYL